MLEGDSHGLFPGRSRSDHLDGGVARKNPAKSLAKGLHVVNNQDSDHGSILFCQHGNQLLFLFHVNASRILDLEVSADFQGAQLVGLVEFGDFDAMELLENLLVPPVILDCPVQLQAGRIPGGLDHDAAEFLRQLLEKPAAEDNRHRHVVVGSSQHIFRTFEKPHAEYRGHGVFSTVDLA
ncbi:hypothetical protein SDC9_200484 [bioreactor metagenome]|uniref:Uncharacterized protein n=1 Tax=bioreactor metagenome TaxID=1076179 RepID=A0A645INC7_9ZZZZ